MPYTRVNWKDYPNTSTPANASNLNKMDGAISELDSKVSEHDRELDELREAIANMILDKLYPVGSIYLDTTNTNPSSKLGGTWVAFGSSTDYLRLGGNGSGGNNSYSLTSNNIPSHTHAIGAHSHGLNGHTHSIPTLSGSASEAGTHNHALTLWDTSVGAVTVNGGSSNWVLTQGGTSKATISNNGAHTHTVTTNASTTGQSSGNTANSDAFNSGAYGATNVTAVPITPKYVQVYAWKRVS